MDVDDLPDAARLWTRFSVLAALDRATGGHTWSLDAANHVLKYDGRDGVRLRMQRLFSGRSVLWGSTGDTLPAGWRDIPGWVTSDAVHDWLRAIGASVLAWHYRGEWDTATPDADLEPLLGRLLHAEVPAGLLDAPDDPEQLRRALTPHASPETLERNLAEALGVLAGARGEAPTAQGVVRTVLVGEIRAQMRRTPDRERPLPRQPAMLVRWSRVATPPPGFVFAVRHEHHLLVPEEGNGPLAQQHHRSLVALLEQLRSEEAGDESGAWLFARVRHDGLRIELDRAFDGWPAWFDQPEDLSLPALAEEMAGRAPSWRPAWSRLLPA